MVRMYRHSKCCTMGLYSTEFVKTISSDPDRYTIVQIEAVGDGYFLMEYMDREKKEDK